MAKADEIRAFLPKNESELRFYHPNSNVQIVESFNYCTSSRPTEHIDPAGTERINGSIGHGTVMALVANAKHDPNFMDYYTYAKRRPRAWLKRVTCSGCHIVYSAIRAKKCPNCGVVNEPKD